jgi:RNA polymerase sigma-70 factor (ECF subfamily)
VNARIEQAVKRLQSGGATAVEEALEDLTTSAYSFAMRVCGNREDAEDVAQETMIRLAPSLNSFSNGRGLALWLYKVAKTRCLMNRRLSKFAPSHRLSLDELMPHPHETARGPPPRAGQRARRRSLDQYFGSTSSSVAK